MTLIRISAVALLTAFLLSGTDTRANEKAKESKDKQANDAGSAMVVLLREEFPLSENLKKLLLGDKAEDKKLRDELPAIFQGLPAVVGSKISIAYKFGSPTGVEQAKLRFRIHKKGNEAPGEYKTLALAETRDDPKKGPFDVERGCFKESAARDSIWFFALPERKTGGGRFYLETKTLGQPAIEKGDRLEFYIEIYSDGKVTARSQSRTKEFCSLEELTMRILAAHDEWQRIREIEKKQAEVFDPDGKDAKKKAK